MFKLVFLCICILPAMSFRHLTSNQEIPVDYPGEVVWIDFRPTTPTQKTISSNILDFESITLPLKRAGNLILLEAIIDSIPGNLILDTGSSGLVLNSIYFRHSRKSGNLVAGGITGSTGTVAKSQIKNLQISAINFQNLDADILDLGHLEKARNVKVLGFFGLSLFADFEVVIDLYRSVMVLHQLDYSGKRLDQSTGSQAVDINLSVQVFSDVIFVDGYIAGRKLIFCLDTGAESNVLGSHLPNKVINTVSVYRRSELRGAGAQSVEVLYGSMNDFTFGKSPISGMKTIITNLGAMSDSYGVRIDGMLGCDFLERGLFYLNLKQKKLGIAFNKEEEK